MKKEHILCSKKKVFKEGITRITKHGGIYGGHESARNGKELKKKNKEKVAKEEKKVNFI
eukprot:UN04258